jgi:monoamine oxidase
MSIPAAEPAARSLGVGVRTCGPEAVTGAVSRPEVVVVGAGAAGLAAARTLLAAGRQVLLLEARRRIGGRAWTVTLGGGQPFDMGASFIHAAAENPWTAIARRLRVATAIDPRRRLVFVAGRPASAVEHRAFVQAREAVLAQVQRVAAGGRDLSLAEATTASGPFAAQALAALGPWLLGVDNEAASAQEFARARTGADRFVGGGHGRLVEAYGRGLPVVLDAEVRAVDLRGPGVRIRTADHELTAPFAILTLPLGVLAAERVRFTPPLPLAWQRAVDALPMGRLAKVGLAFTGDPFGLGDTFYLHEQCVDQRTPLFLVRPGGQDLVQTFVGGGLALDLERLDERAAGEVVLEPLVRLFGSRVRSRLRDVRHTRWDRDPHSLGSYTVARPGGVPARAALRLPLAGRLVLAGEALADDGWAATVAGAQRSGRTAAAWVLAHL